MTTLLQRYELAASLNFGAREAALRHGSVRPRWSADGGQFWYRVRGDEGLEYVRVDVAARRRQPLFDAPSLSAALSKAVGIELQAGALDLADLQLDDAATGRLSFVAHGGCWCWQGDQGRLVRVADAFAAHESVAPDGLSALSLNGPNLQWRDRDQREAVAVTHDGEPDRGYGDFVDFISQVSQQLSGQPRKPSLCWAPDSSRVAVQRVDLRHVAFEHLVQSVPADSPRPRLHRYRYPTPLDEERGRAELWFIGRDGRRVRAQLEGLECHSHGHLALGLGRWSADARHFHLVDRDRGAQRWVLWCIDSHDGSARPLFEERGPAVVLPAPSIAESPVFHVLRDGRLIVWSQRSGWGHLHLVDREGRVQAITRGDWQVRGLLQVDEDAGQIVFTASGREAGLDPYFVFAYRVALDGSGLLRLTPEPAQHEWFLAAPEGERTTRGFSSLAPDGSCFVDNASTVGQAPCAVLRDRQGDVLLALEAAPPADTWPAVLPLPEPFVVTALAAAALDGAGALWGVLYRPADFDPGQRYPVIELVYGAPQTAVVPKSWISPRYGVVAEQLAALGFVVMIIDGPGTPYRSRAFQLASHGHLESCGGLPDHVNAIRQLAATRPWMDLDRVGMVGASGGGYATVQAMARFPDFFKAGVAMCGNHDQASYIAMWGECYQGPYEPALYAAAANAEVAGAITGALLLIHGDVDDNVHPAMTMRVVEALIRADRDFEMLLVPNAGHMLILQPYVQRRIWNHFVRHLRGEVPPKPLPTSAATP